MELDWQQLGIVGILFYFAIKEFFAWLPKVTGKTNGVEAELKLMNSNHLTHIEQAIREQTKTFQDDHRSNNEILNRHTELLTEIKTRLEK